MKLIITLFLFLVFTVCTFAQLDTNDYFPMHVGDRWQYSFLGTDGYAIHITGDTIMPNGNRYFIREVRYDPNIPDDDPWYLRKRDDGVVVRYNRWIDKEYEWLNLKAQKGEIWFFLPSDSTSGFWGLKDTGSYFSSLAGSILKYKLFDCVSMPDTIWCSDFPDTEPPTLTQGLGITGTFFSSCYGAIINGVTYGTVSVEDETEILPEHFSLSQNYPNPFNPETVIRFTLPVAGYTKGVVYDVLGNEVTTLLNGDMSAGNHEVRFNAIDLSSGVYFFRLESGNYSSAIKMVVGK